MGDDVPIISFVEVERSLYIASLPASQFANTVAEPFDPLLSHRHCHAVLLGFVNDRDEFYGVFVG